jgi:hypothetical protein
MKDRSHDLSLVLPAVYSTCMGRYERSSIDICFPIDVFFTQIYADFQQLVLYLQEFPKTVLNAEPIKKNSWLHLVLRAGVLTQHAVLVDATLLTGICGFDYSKIWSIVLMLASSKFCDCLTTNVVWFFQYVPNMDKLAHHKFISM